MAGRASSLPPVDAEVRPSGVQPSLAQRVLMAAIRGYQLAFSPFYTGSCRYVPSCSSYALEAVERFGTVRGGWLALRRLARCHPFGGHGLDPLPAYAPSELRRGEPGGAPSELRSGKPAAPQSPTVDR